MATNEELKASLAELRAALSAGKPLDDRQRAKLDDVLGDIGKLLDGDEEHAHDSLADRLQEAAEHFEDTHPELTLAIGSVASILSRMGI